MKNDIGLFHATMGIYGGEQLCKLVGTFLSDKISQEYNKSNIGLYCDDDLVAQNQKKLKRIFKNCLKKMD